LTTRTGERLENMNLSFAWDKALAITTVGSESTAEKTLAIACLPNLPSTKHHSSSRKGTRDRGNERGETTGAAMANNLS